MHRDHGLLWERETWHKYLEFSFGQVIVEMPSAHPTMCPEADEYVKSESGRETELGMAIL